MDVPIKSRFKVEGQAIGIRADQEGGIDSAKEIAERNPS